MFVTVLALAIVLLLVITMALAKSAGIVSRREEQTELERLEKMKANIEAEWAKTEGAK